ncbi:MAG: MATE family efflux transporter [Candidatus Bathyarchaeia archaeon]
MAECNMAEEIEAPLELHDVSRYREKIVNGPIIRTFFWLGIPPALNQLVLIAYNVADTYWLSCYNELCVSVPRQVFPVIMLFQALVMGTNAACLSIISQYIGARAYKNASIEASRFFTVACITGVTLNITLLALREWIFSWLIFTPPEIFSEVMAFSAVTAFDVLFMAVAFTFTTLLQSLGDTRRPAIINIISVAINVALDPFFVLGIGPFPRLGVVGAALTDVMGKILSIIGQAIMLRKNYSMLRLGFTSDLNFEWAKIVLKIGFPVLSFGLLNGFAFILQQRLINMLGIVAATAFSIGFVIVQIVDGVLFGLCQATAIMVGQNLGATNPRRAREVAFKTTVVVFILVAMGAFIVYPIKRSIIDIFTSSPDIILETERFLSIVLPSLPFFGVCINIMSIGRGSGRTSVPTTIEIIRIWAVRIALGYFLAFIANMNTMGVWLPFALSNIIGGVALSTWAKYGKWDKAIIKLN